MNMDIFGDGVKRITPRTLDVSTNTVKYNLDFDRKITLLTGDSGNGKSRITYIVENINKGLGYKMRHDFHKVIVLRDTTLVELMFNQIATLSNALIIIDEDDLSQLMSSGTCGDMYGMFNDSSNYFLLITRNIPRGLVIAGDAIKTLSTTPTRVFTCLYPQTQAFSLDRLLENGKLIVTEDSMSGAQFVNVLRKNKGVPAVKVLTADGFANIPTILKDVEVPTVLFADNATVGVVLDLISSKSIDYVLPESLEFVLLSSYLFESDTDLQCILKSHPRSIPLGVISGEHYYTDLIHQRLLAMTGTGYDKSKLPLCFTEDNCFLRGRRSIDCKLNCKDKRDIFDSMLGGS